jgi:hypothetical protein
MKLRKPRKSSPHLKLAVIASPVAEPGLSPATRGITHRIVEAAINKLPLLRKTTRPRQ